MRKGPRALPWLLCLLTLCAVSPAGWSHQLRLFASAEGDRIEGSVAYAGGGPAAGVAVQVLDPGGRVLTELTSDVSGRFGYRARARFDHRLVALTGEGHAAEWTIRATELPAALPVTPGAETNPNVEPSETPERRGDSGSVAELEAMIERAVARQIRPLREELQAAEARARVSDLLGGIGYILGIAGLALWWHARRWGRRD